MAASWTQVGHYTGGTQATFDVTGLAGYTEFLVIVRLVTKSVSGRLFMQASIDNGANYLAANGDYKDIDAAGVEGNSTTLGADQSTNATAARSGWMRVLAADAGMPLGLSNGTTPKVFVNSTSPITALRVIPNNAGNLTGGDIYVFAR